MSRRTARVSREGNFSNAVYMLCVIEISWLIVGSSGRKPDWFGVSYLRTDTHIYIHGIKYQLLEYFSTNPQKSYAIPSDALSYLAT